MPKVILAIDDERSMLAFYQAALSDMGEVRTAGNMVEARQKMAEADLILLDFYLEHDKETIQEIVPELKKHAPVLLCSGVQDVGVPAIGATLGIAGYWNKSANHEALRGLVRSTLGG